jgi:hypothetical protein
MKITPNDILFYVQENAYGILREDMVIVWFAEQEEYLDCGHLPDHLSEDCYTIIKEFASKNNMIGSCEVSWECEDISETKESITQKLIAYGFTKDDEFDSFMSIEF